MQGKYFMQLFIILALLLYGGKSGAQNLINEVKPMLETFGGEEVKNALKSAEEISQVITAVRGFTGGTSDTPEFRAESEPAESPVKPSNPDVSFPLAPISSVANREITYSLSEYFSR